jgi:hypothetical protein
MAEWRHFVNGCFIAIGACLIANGCQAFTITPGQEIATNSFVHKPLAPNAPLDPNSAALVAGLNAQAPVKYINTSEYASPIFIVGRDQPTVRVQSAPYWDAASTGHTDPFDPYPPIQADWMEVPLPDNFAGGGGNDNSAIVYQPSTGRYWEMSVLAKTGKQVTNSAGVLVDEWSAAWGGQISNIAVNPGYWEERPNTYGLGFSGSGITVLGIIMTIEEQKAGVINHPIGIGLPVTKAGPFSWPARRGDGWANGDPNVCGDQCGHAVPIGTRFRLPADMNLDAMDMDPYARMIAKAVQKYGFVVTDTTAIGTLVIAAENGASNYGTGANDPYYGVGGLFRCPTYDYNGPPPVECMPMARLASFPWTSLQALKPCYFDYYNGFPRPIYQDGCDAALP